MKKLRVLVLVHEDHVPPESLEGFSDKEVLEWKAEFDVVSTLREMGHEARPLGVQYELGKLRDAIVDWKPQVSFNLLEEFHGNSLYDQHVASYLELMRQAYTGCNPRGLMLTHDKALSKKILSYHRVRVPRFAVFPLGRRLRPPKRLRYPLFVKSLVEEGSYGISQASIVSNEEKLRERVEYLHEQLQTPAMAEEYIEGRELYVAVLGNRRLQVLPILELTFGNLPEGAPNIATSKVKWDWEYQKERQIDTQAAKDLTPALEQRIYRLSRRIYRLLNLSGYARIDLRLSPDGQVWVLEANANPDLAYGEELSCATEAAGMKYDALLQKIMNLGLRYRRDAGIPS